MDEIREKIEKAAAETPDEDERESCGLLEED